MSRFAPLPALMCLVLVACQETSTHPVPSGPAEPPQAMSASDAGVAGSGVAAVPAPPSPDVLEPDVIEFDSPIPQAVAFSDVTITYKEDQDRGKGWFITATLTNRSRVPFQAGDVLAMVHASRAAARVTQLSRVMLEEPLQMGDSAPWATFIPVDGASATDQSIVAGVKIERWVDVEAQSAWVPLDPEAGPPPQPVSEPVPIRSLMAKGSSR